MPVGLELAYLEEESEEAFFGGFVAFGGGLEQYFLSTSSNKSSMSSPISLSILFFFKSRDRFYRNANEKTNKSKHPIIIRYDISVACQFILNVCMTFTKP